MIAAAMEHTPPPQDDGPKGLPPWMQQGPLERISARLHHFAHSGLLLMTLSAIVFCVAVVMILSGIALGLHADA